MVLERIVSLAEGREPLRLVDLPEPRPGEGEVLLRVSACGVCHTELDEIEGRTPPPRLPVVPGHQVIGRVVESGPGAGRYPVGTRLGVAWIFSACGACPHCLGGNENLCPAERNGLCPRQFNATPAQGLGRVTDIYHVETRASTDIGH